MRSSSCQVGRSSSSIDLIRTKSSHKPSRHSQPQPKNNLNLELPDWLWVGNWYRQGQELPTLPPPHHIDPTWIHLPGPSSDCNSSHLSIVHCSAPGFSSYNTHSRLYYNGSHLSICFSHIFWDPKSSLRISLDFSVPSGDAIRLLEPFLRTLSCCDQFVFFLVRPKGWVSERPAHAR